MSGVIALFEQNGTNVPLQSGIGYGPVTFFSEPGADTLANVYPASGGGLVYFSAYVVSNYNLFLQSDFVSTGGNAGFLNLQNLNLQNGSPCYPYPTCNVFTGDALTTYYDGYLLIASPNTPKIGGFIASSGSVLWPQESLKGSIDTLPTGGTNSEFVVGYSNLNVLAAVNATNGKPIWNFTTGAPVVGAPAFANGNFFFGTAGGAVYSVSSAGNQNWNVNLGAGLIDSTPAIAFGDAFVSTDDNHIYALNATTGAKLWNFTGDGPFFASPAVSSNKIIYDGSTEGIVYAVNATNGHRIWSFDTGAPITANPVLDCNSTNSVCNSNNAGALFVVNQRGKIFAFPDPTPVTTPSVFPLPQWSQFQGNAAHDGNSSSIGPVTPLNLWTSTVGGSNDAVIADNHQVIVSSIQNNQLIALGEQNGTRLFNFLLPTGLGTVYPASHGGLVFFSKVVGLLAIYRGIFLPLEMVVIKQAKHLLQSVTRTLAAV